MKERKKGETELFTLDEVKKYFQVILDNQTQEIKKIISELQLQRNDEEKNALKVQLDEEKVKKRKMQNLINENQKLVDMANLKNVELERQFEQLKGQKIELENTLKNLNFEISELETQKKNLLDEKMRVIQKHEFEIRSISEKNSALEYEMNIYKERYSDMDNAYRRYRALSLESKTRLHNIFESDSIYGIVGACYDWRNIEGVWNFTKRRIIEQEMNDVENLVNLFEFLVNAHNAQKGQTRYELIKPSIGEKFDSDLHNILGTRTDGFVSVVRLSGIRDVANQRIVQKALIEV